MHRGGGYRAAGKQAAVASLAVAVACTGRRSAIFCRPDGAEHLAQLCLERVKLYGHQARREGNIIYIIDRGYVEIVTTGGGK